VFNSVFVVCLFLIAVVTCLFSPELKRSNFLDSPGNLALVVILMLIGAGTYIYTYLSYFMPKGVAEPSRISRGSRFAKTTALRNTAVSA
jgi:fumarate reductase subunit C